jgi:hypothetical protein
MGLRSWSVDQRKMLIFIGMPGSAMLADFAVKVAALAAGVPDACFSAAAGACLPSVGARQQTIATHRPAAAKPALRPIGNFDFIGYF